MIHLKRFGIGLFVGLLLTTIGAVVVYFAQFYPVVFFSILGIALVYVLGGAVLE